LDGLAQAGLLFERAYANPVCSPTRAALLSGRYGRRTGVGTGVQVGAGEPDLSTDELLLPAMLGGSASRWDTSFIGKWHVTSAAERIWTAPGDAGFGWYAHTPGNLSDGEGVGGRQDYQRWRKGTNGEAAWVDGYATTDVVDDALARIRAMEPPWLLFVAFHAAHTPLHAPPAALLDGAPVGEGEVAQYRAMLRALDHEVGRLLAGIPDETRASTLVVFMGDNGTSEHGMPEGPLRERAKGTLFEAGVHVPMIVTGPGVPAARVGGLIDPTDLFATVAELADVARPLRRADGSERVTDGVSWLPYLADPDQPSLRRWAWVEQLAPSGCEPGVCARDQVAMIGPRYKLMYSDVRRGEVVYDLERDPGETRPLTALKGEAAAEVAQMRAELARARAWLRQDRPR
jgi:arylsulfatase A-like enzyme